METLLYQLFSEVNLEDHFFDSLKKDYMDFPLWFQKKANAREKAYVFYINSKIEGFLYLKTEEEALTDVTPALPFKKRLKVGTLKINPHGTKLGERFLKKIFDSAFFLRLPEIYLTVFSKHDGLIFLLKQYGFIVVGEKHTSNGTELVFLRSIEKYDDATSAKANYPLINLKGSNCYLLSLYPDWHSRLLPDSILSNEPLSIVQDISPTNSIHKVYLAKMRGMEHLTTGDVIVIYRTTDGQGPAEYRSVATSICVIEEYRDISSFHTMDDFLSYCSPYSIFTYEELQKFWTEKKYFHIIKFSYNLALNKKIIRKDLIDIVGLNRDHYFGFLSITPEQVRKIAKLGEVNENIIIN